MGYECFAVDIDDKVAHVRMIRPDKANSMIPSFWSDLPEIIDGLSSGGEVRAIVLSGEGKHFCSGMDLAVFGGQGIGAPNSIFERPSRLAEHFRSKILKLQDAFTSLERARVPVICAIQGACIGGGIDMVSAADIRYGTESAFFSIQEINIGMTADVGTLQRLPKLIPEGILKELAFTGRRWAATEAQSAGFLNAVYPNRESMLEAALAVADEISSKSPLAVWGTKRAIHYSREHSTPDSLEFIANWNAAHFDSTDVVEAFTASQQDRPGDFPNLGPLSDGLT